MSAGIDVPSNPFATRFVRPGALPYLTDNTEQWNRWQQDFKRHRVMQIVGPHGVGKTTLAMALIRSLPGGDFERRWLDRVTLRRKTALNRWQAGLQIVRNGGEWLANRDRSDAPLGIWRIVDGIECLSPLHRQALLNAHRIRSGGLLVTAHRRLRGVPVLARLTPCREQLDRIVACLSPDWYAQPHSNHRLERLFDGHAGNIRECLMELFDDWERERPR